MSFSTLPRTAALIALALAAAACDDDDDGPTGGDGAGNGEVSFNLAVRPASAPGTPGEETFTDGTNTLVITSAQVVLREIELEGEDDDDCSTGVGGDDDCDELEIGPVLLDLPLGTGGPERNLTVDVPAGTYEELEFDIHKPDDDDDDDGDAEFLAAHPEFEDVSIRVVGTWNDAPFTFTTDLEAEQEIELSPPLVVNEDADTDLTLLLDLDTWFRGPGGGLIDPATANAGGAAEALVEDQIEASIEAFDDDECDDDDDDD